MDEQHNISEMQRGELTSEDIRNLIKPLVLNTNKMDVIWSRIQNIPYIFDDFNRGYREKFFGMFYSPDTVAYEIGDFGLIYFTNVCPPINAVAHVVFWDRKFTNRTPIFRKLCEDIFNDYFVHRISSIVPTFNRAAIIFAKRAGFHLEAVHREIILSLGKWHDAAILGLLRRDLNGSEHRRTVSVEHDNNRVDVERSSAVHEQPDELAQLVPDELRSE